jgi:endonuclease YncB( thermonuclease family)
MLTDNREIILMGVEKDQYGRSVVEVFAMTDTPGVEVGVNGEMVAAGMAHYYERYKSACPMNAELYKNLELDAVVQKAGVWANGDLGLAQAEVGVITLSIAKIETVRTNSH